jgi:hypothetical protein
LAKRAEFSLRHARRNVSSRFAPRRAQKQRARNQQRFSLGECHWPRTVAGRSRPLARSSRTPSLVSLNVTPGVRTLALVRDIDAFSRSNEPAQTGAHYRDASERKAATP